MSEPKRAAVVKRGAERENRDLFAMSSRADYGSVKETLRPPPPDSTLGVAARNESSVLFTVDALKGAARVKTPEPELAPMSTPPSAFKSDDDEGVIDLMALSSGSARPGARPVPALFPSEPPPGAFAADVSDSGNHAAQGGFRLGKRAFIGMAAAAVALVLCTLGLAAAFKGEEPAARAAATMAPPAPVAPPVVTPPAPPAATETAATASASSSSDDDEKSTKKKSGKGKASKASGAKLHSGGGAASSKAKLSSSEPAKPAATPKAADKCGCKGDFNCILRCTAKGS